MKTQLISKKVYHNWQEQIFDAVRMRGEVSGFV